MKTQEWRTIDKSDWDRGPWDNEPDKRQWTDEATGLPCLIVRGHHGGLCGYVGVEDGHPFYMVDYDACPVACGEFFCDEHSAAGLVTVHGGLTFTDKCRPGDTEAKGICHAPGPGESDDVWWLGFDCAHCYDQVPGHESASHDLAYRDFPYVQEEVKRLAAQLKAFSTSGTKSRLPTAS